MAGTAEFGSRSGLSPNLDRPEPGARVFVWGTWGVMLLAAFWFVGQYGAEVPLWDDFELVPRLTGQQPVTARWLWSQHNEHRIPLPRLVLLAAYHLAHFDFRAGMFVNVALLGTLAAGLIRTAGALRGSTCYSDAFFPVALLHLGHHANLLWSFQVAFVLATVLAGFVLTLLIQRGARLGLGSASAAALLLALLPLCGANGVALVPALAFWYCGAAASRWRSGEPKSRRDALALVGLAAPALTLSVLYFHSYQRPQHHDLLAEPLKVLATSLQFLAAGFGPATAELWPFSGLAVLVALVSSVAVLAAVGLREPGERSRASALLTYLGAAGCLALGLGWGRAGASALAGFQDRYVALATPALFGIYFTWELYGPATTRRLIPTCLFVTVCVLLWPNTMSGLAHGRESRGRALAFDRDIRAGVPMFLLIKRHASLLHPSQDALGDGLRMLHRARIGIFRQLREDPPFHEVALSQQPTMLLQATWSDGTAHVTGVDPYLVYELPQTREVCGIRLRYSHVNRTRGAAHFQVSWRREGQRADLPDQRYGNWSLPSGEDRETTVWIGEPIREIRIQPDNQPCEFRVHEIVLLVPRPSSLGTIDTHRGDR